MARKPDSESEALSLYLQEIREHPILDREQEVALAQRIRSGDDRALNELVAANLRFVVSVARRYAGHGVPLADLVTEGNVGLLRAASRFDETKGVRFISYAVWWVRQSILQALTDGTRIVRIPAGQLEASNRVVRGVRRLEQELGREPTIDEVALELELTPGEVTDALGLRSGWVSLDAPLPDDSDSSMLDLLPDLEIEDADDAAAHAALRDVVEEGLTRLPEREAEVLRLYFGLAGEPARSLQEIATALRLTRERVRMIKDRALVRLRVGETGRVLRGFR
ncbi:MAG: RNA polymerase sigma factor RpoD/SigA [marine benthic group bacterium]|nr:RNA polymerase sigma factor RpoD/SigA [Gemmatimonadota bacterium]MCL7962723.1 RNA polymerase sigma factor RpoD/SigA [Candidatus Carthagonibacter metallireducens]MCL7956729.1 RNA polymerase sigma factor RpoD/SigA [Gemmatimonadota bacterium]MCL7964773.1 RNA polymerase sigma factor RpoD/SigA [Gemmatimonadota bacterium]MCL7967552.1 RNA polymerase sigma factor RpoD/SigA [Gemmatimonadota bacterium]